MRFLTFALLCAVCGPAAAQDSPSAEKPKEQKRVCRMVDVTGSYLGAKRECHTKAEWERRAEQARESFSRRRTGGLRPSE